MVFYLHKAEGVLGGDFAWSFGAVSSSTATEAAAETAWAAGIAAMFNATAFNGFLPSDVTLTLTSTSTATALFKQTTKTETTHSIAGVATTSLPYQVGEIVTLRTNLATKYGHGRWFLPPLGTGALASGGFVLSSAATDAIVAAVNAAFAAWTGTLALQILHRKAPIGGGVAAMSTTPVSSGDVSNKFVIQKRRADKLTVTRTAITV